MVDLLLIAIKYSLVSNVVLSQFLGICAFLGVSKKSSASKGPQTRSKRHRTVYLKTISICVLQR